MNYQELFNYLSREHEVDLLESDMQHIVKIVYQMILDSGMTIEDIKQELTYPREM